MFPFQRLHPGQFIITDHFFTLGRQSGRLFVELVDVAAFFIKYGFTIAAGQPVTDLVRFDVCFFLKDAPRVGAKWSRRCHV